MTGLRLISSMNNLPDEMIAEAMFAKKYRTVRSRWWYIPIAACLSLYLLCTVIWLVPEDQIIPPQETDSALMLTEEELHASIYSAFCPDYAALGCELEQAGIYGETHFKAVFYSTKGQISVDIAPMTELNDVFMQSYEERLIDMETAEQTGQQPLQYPVFLEEQFSEQCRKYIQTVNTQAGYQTMQFAVVTQEYMIVYSFHTISTEYSSQWITAVFDSICRRYTRK